MNVRQVIGNALRLIGVSTIGVEELSGDQFNQNLLQFQLLADGLRLNYPFKTTTILNNSQLADVNYIQIDSMASSLSFPNSQRYPMEEVTLEEYNRLNINPNIQGFPRFYYFQKPSLVMVWPNDPNYQIQIVGKINSALGLNGDTVLDPSPLFFQDFLEKNLAARLSPFYKKDWTQSMQKALDAANKALTQNTDYDYTVMTGADTDGTVWTRPRYYTKNA